MPLLWVRYAVPAADGPQGEKRVTFVADMPGDDVQGPIFQIIMSGPAGGAVEIPDAPINRWQMFDYEHLPLGYHGTVERIR